MSADDEISRLPLEIDEFLVGTLRTMVASACELFKKIRGAKQDLSEDPARRREQLDVLKSYLVKKATRDNVFRPDSLPPIQQTYLATLLSVDKFADLTRRHRQYVEYRLRNGQIAARPPAATVEGGGDEKPDQSAPTDSGRAEKATSKKKQRQKEETKCDTE